MTACHLRRATGQELNKGESRHSLARAVFIHRLGEFRDRGYENQQHRASGLNFLVTAIILGNTRYLERAAAALRQTEDVPDHLLAHLSPLGWEHVNLTGNYVWGAAEQMTENPDGFRPLRRFSDPTRPAAQVHGLSAYAYQEAVSLVLANTNDWPSCPSKSLSIDAELPSLNSEPGCIKVVDTFQPGEIRHLNFAQQNATIRLEVTLRRTL
jgi:Tn3 transposase DDE domain